jgi:sortase A
MNQKKIFKICSVIMALSGITILFSSLYPILSYEWDASQKYPILISPLVDEDTGDFKFSGSDSARLETWFPAENSKDFGATSKTYYTVTIPKLKISDATVAIGSDDLKDSLVQYPGTALPGKVGNTVVFGHSILPQYFEPSNYMSIFSTLYTLKKGDEIFADFDGVTYKYRVESIFEVKPTDIQILEQNSSDSYLSLVTCSPPGHPLKPRRLIVRARLVPPQLDTSRVSYGGEDLLPNDRLFLPEPIFLRL